MLSPFFFFRFTDFWRSRRAVISTPDIIISSRGIALEYLLRNLMELVESRFPHAQKQEKQFFTKSIWILYLRKNQMWRKIFHNNFWSIWDFPLFFFQYEFVPVEKVWKAFPKGTGERPAIARFNSHTHLSEKPSSFYYILPILEIAQ